MFNREVIIHGLKVAAFVIGSSVIPAIISLYTGNVNFMVLAPILNVIAAMLVKYSDIQKAASA